MKHSPNTCWFWMYFVGVQMEDFHCYVGGWQGKYQVLQRHTNNTKATKTAGNNSKQWVAFSEKKNCFCSQHVHFPDLKSFGKSKKTDWCTQSKSLSGMFQSYELPQHPEARWILVRSEDLSPVSWLKKHFSPIVHVPFLFKKTRFL